MKMKLLTTLALFSVCSSSVVFADTDGVINITGNVAGIKGNSAKFNEYRSIGDGAKLDFDISSYFLNDTYLDFSGANIGYNSDSKEHYYNDLSVNFKVGKFDSTKFYASYKEIPHNMTFGASTYFSGAGTTTLAAPVASNATQNAFISAYANTFDYGVNRKNLGLGLELSLKSPFFFSADFEQIKAEGVLPQGIYNGSYTSGNLKEIPVPIDFTTQNVVLQTGYRSNNLIVKLDGTISQFSNNNQTLTYTYTNAQTALAGWNNRNTVYLAPESTYFKVGGSLMYRMPLLDSTLMARASHSQSENTIALSEAGRNFDGKLEYTTASATLTANPLKKLNATIFYNYLNKNNASSDSFAYGNNNGAHPVKGTALNITEKYSYHKQNIGAGASYKLPANTKISAGYEYLKYMRGVRTDATDTTDHSAYLQLKNDYLDWLSGKIRYQYLTRESTNANANYYLNNFTPTMEMYFRPADTADKNQHVIKAAVDIEPLNDLSINVEYGYKINKYKNYVLGMMDDNRHELYADATYAYKMLKFTPFVDLELVNAKSRHRVGNASVYAAPTNTQYNWQSDRKDVNIAFGLNTDADIIKDKFTARLGWRYEKANGTEEFTGEGVNLATVTSPVVNNSAVDNYMKQTLLANLNYMVTKNIKIGLNYAYERLKYADDHYDAYTNVPAQTTHFTGAYANPDYEAHVGYITVGYKF